MYSYAYIHYMTLNDISARGYVRQFCMSYISRKERCVIINKPFIYIYVYVIAITLICMYVVAFVTT